LKALSQKSQKTSEIQLDRAQLEDSDILAWVTINNMVNENDQPLEFVDHRFLIEPYMDNTPDQVIMKSAQVGWSVLAILKSKWYAKHRRFNIIYVLPTRNVVKDFVTPKVNPLIFKNKVIRDSVTVDSINLKQIGDRFIYYRGAFSDVEAISISADLVIADEYDRSDQNVLITYQSRLQASKHGYYWKFSNPSIPGFGVHELFLDSDQMHWFVTCSHCKHEWFIEFNRDNKGKNHYVDHELEIYACGNCHKELSDDDRRDGRWIAKFPGRERRGYHISQLFMPWVSAKKIMIQYRESDSQFFYNFVLGLPYLAAEFVINRSSFIAITTPDKPKLENLVLGVDNGVEKHWVLGNINGIISYGKTESWEDIESMIIRYNCITVIDANPYPDIPKKLAEKYRGKVFIHYYQQDTKNLGISRWGDGERQGVIFSDRTKLLDLVAGEINNHEMSIFINERELEGLIYHSENMYRAIESNDKGIEKGVWLTKPNKPDHWLHCIAYWRVGISKLGSSANSGVVTSRKRGVLVNPSAKPYTDSYDISEIAKKTESKGKRAKRKRGY
jgi:hypothetical protein